MINNFSISANGRYVAAVMDNGYINVYSVSALSQHFTKVKCSEWKILWIEDILSIFMETNHPPVVTTFSIPENWPTCKASLIIVCILKLRLKVDIVSSPSAITAAVQKTLLLRTVCRAAQL